MREAAILGLLGLFLPAWIFFGLSDWHYHRKSDIAHTSGWRESGLHLVLTGQAGGAVLLAMFFDVTTLVLALLILAYVAHEITTSLDVGYAAPRRAVVAHEQRVHDYLTAIPLTALFAVGVSHPEAWRWLADANQSPDWDLRLRNELPPVWYLAAFLTGSLVNAGAYLEEFIRCWRADHQKSG